MFWIASKLLDFWDWIVDSISVRWWMWKHRHCSTDELLQDAIELIEDQPAGTVVHEIHQMLAEVQSARAAAPSVEQKAGER